MRSSPLHSPLPIFALSPSQRTLNWCALYRGVYPLAFDSSKYGTMVEATREALRALKTKGYLAHGDWIIITHGDTDEHGKTNNMKLMQVD